MLLVNMGNLGEVKLSLAFSFLLLPVLLFAQDARPPAYAASQTGEDSCLNLYVKVQLNSNVKPSALKPGDVVEGKLSRSVYSQDRELFPAGSRVRLTVESLVRRRRAPNDHWPWVVKVFTPHHEKFPTFQSAQILLAGGKEVPLRVSLLSISQQVQVRAEPRKENKAKRSESFVRKIADPATPLAAAPDEPATGHPKPRAHLIANFEASVLKATRVPEGSTGPAALASSSQTMTVAAGTRAKVILLGGISASKSRPGDLIQARLVEPVYSGPTVVLPEGSVFEGKVVKRTPPRMPSRSGSLLFSFTAVTTPRGTAEPMKASVAEVELDRRSRTNVDLEGQLKGDRPGMAWMVMNLAMTGGIAKVSDDGMQLLVEVIVATATDASTAGTARIAGACASGLFLLTRRGRDVVLPKFTEMDIVFDRPLSLSPTQAIPAATGNRGQIHSSQTESANREE
jgi:hypothetical protein